MRSMWSGDDDGSGGRIGTGAKDEVVQLVGIPACIVGGSNVSR